MMCPRMLRFLSVSALASLCFLNYRSNIRQHLRLLFLETARPNRTLVILNGSPRCGEAAWNSLYKQVLDVNRADLALAFGQTSDQKSSLYSRAKYVWEFQEYEDWGTALDQIGTGWRRWGNRENIFGGVNGTKGSGAIILYIRWFVKKQLQREPGLLDQYNWFIYTRSDHYYSCPHDLQLFKQDPYSLYVPKGEAYGGYTDRHLVAPRELILQALSIVDDVAKTQNPEVLKDNKVEQFIKRRWREMGLSVVLFDRMMFTCAVVGDKTRWMKPNEKATPIDLQALGILLKYPQEFKGAKQYCEAAAADKTNVSSLLSPSGCTSRPALVCGDHIGCNSPKNNCSSSLTAPEIYHFVFGYNFRDVIGPTINNFALTGMAPSLSGTREDVYSYSTLLVTLGSVLHHMQKTKKEVHLWGTGHVGARYHKYSSWANWSDSHPQMKVHAVCGALTLDFLYANGIVKDNKNKSNVVLGDPALLLPYVYPQCRRHKNPPRPICLILHNNDKRIIQNANFSDRNHFPKELDAANIWHSTLDFDKMLENILECNLVVSSSLHGIIVAEAFGVPARWVQLRDSAKSEGEFKYCDYYTGSRSGDPSIKNVSSLMRDNGKGTCIGFNDDANLFRPAKTVTEAFSLGGAPPIRGYNAVNLLNAFPLKLMSTCDMPNYPGEMMVGADLTET